MTWFSNSYGKCFEILKRSGMIADYCDGGKKNVGYNGI